MMSFKSSMIISLFILFNSINTQETILNFDLNPYVQECLMEYFPEKTLVIYDISSNITNLQIEIKSSKDVLIKEITNGMKYPFTTYSEGYYEACLENTNDTMARVQFSMKSGVAAKDYSSIARTKDLLPIDLELEKLSDRTKVINQYVNYAQTHEKIFEASLDSISSKIMFFSCVIIGVMILIGFVETLYLRKFMERRKII